MKRFARLSQAVVLGFFVVMMLAIGTGYAEDVKLESRVSGVQVSQDKNGREFVRVLIPEKRNLNGIGYETAVPVMFFGDHAAHGKTLKVGDTLKCIAAKKMWQGSTSYNFLAALK